MADRRALLGPLEEAVLLAVASLLPNGYGVTIRDAVERRGGHSVSFGAIYATLDRLEEKGFVRSWIGEPTPERGGRAKRHFTVEAAGMEALNRMELLRSRLAPVLGTGR